MRKLKDEYVSSQKPWVRMAMKGRTLYIGIQAKGAKNGVLKISKQKGAVDEKGLVADKPFADDGKASKRDKEDEEDEEEEQEGDGAVFFGKCIGNKGTGILTVSPVRGKVRPVHLKFAKYFINKLCKMQNVADVLEGKIDGEVDPKAELPTAATVAKRIEELRKLLAAAGGNAEIGSLLDAAGQLAIKNADAADESLDALEIKITALAPKGGTAGGATVNGKLVEATAAWTKYSQGWDKEIGDLKKAMEAVKDEQIQEIAKNGLTSIDGGARSRLNTALTAMINADKAGDAAARKKASGEAQNAMKELLKLAGDERVKVIADPPTGWPPVTIKATIAKAITELTKAL